MLILKQNTAASVPVPAAGKGTIFLSDSDVLSVKNSSNVVESFPTVGGSNTQVIFNDDAALTGSANYTFDKDTNILTVTGNVAATRVLTDNLLYANGVAWDLQQPAGANTQVIFNDDGDFGASAAFTFNNSTSVLTVGGNVAATRVLTDNLLYANGSAWDLQEPAGSSTEIQFNNGGDFGADSALTFSGGQLSTTTLATTGDAVIGGNLNVNGNLTYVNVDSFRVEDPIIELGGGANGAVLTSNDGKDRGTALQYYTTEAVTAFMGWDNANSEFGFGSVVGIVDEVVTFNSFGNVRADHFIGNGASLTDIVGANVTGEVDFADVANSVAGANVSGEVSYAGIANSVAGGNVTGTVATATSALTVTEGAQTAITSVGTLSSLTVTANVSAGNVNGTGGVFTYVSGDGANLTSLTGSEVTGTVPLATTAGTVSTAAQPNITSVGTLSSVLVGTDADTDDFPNAVQIVSTPDSGFSGTAARIGLAAEATGDSANTTQMAIGLYGVSQANGATRGTGVYGYGSVVSTSDTGASTGVRGVAGDTHASGYNIGLLGSASNSAIGNYSLYLQEGDIGTIENSHNWDLVDNDAGALTFSSTGKANVFLIETTNNAEGIATTGYLNVTGNITATAGLITDNLYYANGNPWDLQQPAGSNTQVIFNDGGDFGADSTFTFDKDTNILSATTVTATTLNGAIGTASQTGITQVGTLGSLDVTNNILAGNVFANSGTIGAGTLTGTLSTAAQTNITSVGTLGELDVTANVDSGNVNATGGVFTYVSGDGANLTSITGQNVSGEVDFAQVANSVAGANVSGEVDFADVANSVAGANVSGAVAFATTANAVAGANVSGEVNFADTANSVAGANVSGEVGFAAVANSVAGANVSGTVALATLAADATSANAVAGANVSGAVSFATTANAVAGANVSGEVSFAATANAVAGANVSGQVSDSATADSATIAATVTTAAQPNITSVGTLSGLSVTGTITGSVSGSASTAGTVTTAAQPNITSVGTLTSLTTSGNVDVSGNVVTDDIIGKTGGVTITAIGTNQPISLVTTGTGSVDVNSARITELATPTAPTDAATKAYVDSVAEGLHIHESCEVATTGTLTSITGGTITYDNGTAGVGATLTTSSGNFNTIDGESFGTGERILVKDESTAANNGIYVKTSSTVLTRADDFDTPTEMAGGDFTFVSTGTQYNDTGWVMTDAVATVGTNPVNFVQFSGAGTFTAGAGLTLTGSEFSITDTAVSAASYGNGTHNATFTVNSRGQLTAAANVEITAGAGSLTGTTINSSVVDSSLTSVGTIDTGVWNGSVIGASYIATLNQNTTGYAATVSTAAQPNITSVGTLSGLTVSGTISGSVSGSAGSVAGQNVSGEVDFAQVANSVAGGNVSGAVAFATTANAVAGANVSGAVSFATTANAVAGANVSGTVASATTAASASSVAGQNVSGEVDFAQVANSVAGANVSGTVASATSATSATTAGSTTSSATFNNSGSGASSGTTFNGGTARTISYNTIGAPSTTGTNASGTWSINVTGSAGSATTATRAATVTTAAQPNITSVGTLSSLNVTGTTNTGTIQSTTLTAGSNSTAGSIIGDWTLTSGSTLNATYADLAEKYTADADYEAGTVVLFAGEAELTVCGNHASHAVAGIITTNPAQVYNAECTAGEGEFVVELALIGRVPCKVIGPVHKGDLIVSSEAPGFGCAADLDNLKVGTIIGKAITGYNGDTPDGVCEVLVGKN